MNELSRFGDFCGAFIYALKMIPATEKCSVPHDLIPILISHVKALNLYITNFLKIGQKFMDHVGVRHDNAKIFAVQNIFIHVNISIHQSGIINDAYIRWLDLVNEQKLQHAYREIEDVYLMMLEILFHIDHYKLQLQRYLSHSENNDLASKSKLTVEMLEKQKKPEMPKELSQLWVASVEI